MLTRSRLIKIAAMLKEKVAVKYIKYDANQITAREKKGLGATGRWTGLTGEQRKNLNNAWRSRNRVKFRSLSRQYRGIGVAKPAAAQPVPNIRRPMEVSREGSRGNIPPLTTQIEKFVGPVRTGPPVKTKIPPVKPPFEKSPRVDAAEEGMRAAGNVWSRKGNRTVWRPQAGVYRSGQSVAKRIAAAAKKKAAPLATNK